MREGGGLIWLSCQGRLPVQPNGDGQSWPRRGRHSAHKLAGGRCRSVVDELLVPKCHIDGDTDTGAQNLNAFQALRLKPLHTEQRKLRIHPEHHLPGVFSPDRHGRQMPHHGVLVAVDALQR